MRMRLFCLLLSLLSFDIQASLLKISEPIKNTAVGFTQMVIAPSDPNIMYGMRYIRTDRLTMYIYRSTDAGQHWQEISTTLDFSKLMVSPSNPRMLYALLDGSSSKSLNTNLFRSEDGGKTWQAAFSDAERAQNCPQSETGSTCLSFDTIGIDRSNGLTLYGTGYWPNRRDAFVKKSVDGGKTWKNIVTILYEKPDDVHNLKIVLHSSLLFFNNDVYIDPSNLSYVVYYRIYTEDNNEIETGVVYNSHDGGETWEIVNAKLPPTINKGQSWFNPQNTNIIYANFYEVLKASLFNTLDTKKSIDNGVTWQSIGLQPISIGNAETYFRFLGLSPADPNTLYATSLLEIYGYSSLMRSKDAGKTWEKLAFPDTTATITAFLFSPVNAKEIYVSTYNSTYNEYDTNGVYKSTDGGDTWKVLNTGFNTNIKILNVIPTLQKENIIVQLTNSEFYRTLDTGDSFKKMSVPNNFSSVMKASKSRANTLYLSRYTPSGGEELYRSDDLGETWQKIFSWDSNEIPYSSPPWLQSSDGKILYTAKLVRDAISGQATNFNWSYSEDFGNTWQAINPPTPIYAPTLHPTDSNILYAIGCASFKSIDKGKTWHSITINPPDNPCVYPSDYSEGLQVDPHDTNILYMLNTSGSAGYRSTDAGLTWNQINAPVNKTSWVRSQLDPKTGFLYAISENIHYRSTDGGQTWVEIKRSVRQKDAYISGSFIVSKNGLYMVSNPSGHLTDIYRSTGGDEAWQWVFSISEASATASFGRIGGQVDHLYNRFFMFNELNKGRLGIFTLDEEAIANPQSTISDAQGYTYPSNRDGVKTLVDSSPTTNKQLTQNTDTQITATFSPSAEYQNQSAELLIVSQFQPQGSTQSYWFMQSNNTWQTWDGSEANLKPTKTVSSLQAMETLDIFTGKPLGLSGISTIYTGYRIPSQGVMVSNKNTPLVLKVE